MKCAISLFIFFGLTLSQASSLQAPKIKKNSINRRPAITQKEEKRVIALTQLILKSKDKTINKSE